MRLVSICLVCCAIGSALGGCATPVPSDPMTTSAVSYAPVATTVPDQAMPAPLAAIGGQGGHKSPLAGRTLVVSSEKDLKLGPHEVVLTFDDGPNPKLTPEVLAILARYGVHATFMMVGRMAESYPATARQVALAGETIGTHTYAHSDLVKDGPAAALADIRKGRAAVAAALAPIGAAPDPFFRFPYLAATPELKSSLSERGISWLDVDIDAKDYYHVPPEEVLQHLLARLDATGRGIVLMHDIHPRTVAILPRFLDALEERGYKVVRLVAAPPTVPAAPAIVTADMMS